MKFVAVIDTHYRVHDERLRSHSVSQTSLNCKARSETKYWATVVAQASVFNTLATKVRT